MRAGNPKAAIDMFIQAGMWDDAHRLSVRYMNPDDVADLYITKAEELEQSSKYVTWHGVVWPDVTWHSHHSVNLIFLPGRFSKSSCSIERSY